MERMDEFMIIIEKLANANSGVIFSTVNAKEANIVMAKIFENSKAEVKIYDHCLSGNIADKYTAFHPQLRRLLADGKNLKILLRSDHDVESKVQEAFIEYSELYKSQLQIKIANKNFLEEIRKEWKIDANFIVNDTNAFRLETSECVNDWRENVEAIGCFNNPDITLRLTQMFDRHFEECSNKILPIFAF